jgi:hypothetical protein
MVPGVAEAENVTLSDATCLSPVAGLGPVVIVITGVTRATVVVVLVEAVELVVVVEVDDVDVDVCVTTVATSGLMRAAVADVLSVNEPPKIPYQPGNRGERLTYGHGDFIPRTTCKARGRHAAVDGIRRGKGREADAGRDSGRAAATLAPGRLTGQSRRPERPQRSHRVA